MSDASVRCAIACVLQKLKRQEKIQKRINSLKASIGKYDEELSRISEQLDRDDMSIDVAAASEFIAQVKGHRETLLQILHEQQQAEVAVVQAI